MFSRLNKLPFITENFDTPRRKLVRLSTGELQGRVEIKGSDGWGTMCSSGGWVESVDQANKNAKVVCRQQGHQGGEYLGMSGKSVFNFAPNVIYNISYNIAEANPFPISFVRPIRCSGFEANIDDCSVITSNISCQFHVTDVIVRCERVKKSAKS